MNIYVARKKKTYGPYTMDQFQKHLARGKIADNDQFWIQSGWHVVSDLPCVLAGICDSRTKDSGPGKRSTKKR
jgi:hypothetical protein